MNYTSLLIKFRAGDVRAGAFVTYLTSLPHNGDKPVFSHFMFWRPASGCSVVELHLPELRASQFETEARHFGAFAVQHGTFAELTKKQD